MCEIIICAHDVGNSGILAIDSHAPKQGDVIDVRPDGWGWSGMELQFSPTFRIIKLPNVTELQASNMLTPELDVDPQNPSPYLQYRGRFLDKSKISPATAQALLDLWNDAGRTQGFISLPYTAAQINNIITIRTPIPFP